MPVRGQIRLSASRQKHLLINHQAVMCACLKELPMKTWWQLKDVKPWPLQY